MKKKNSIPLIDPITFEKNYINHALMKEDGFDGRGMMLRDENCIFVISRMEIGMKYLNFPKESIKMTYYELMFVTDGYYVATENLNEFTHNKQQIRFSSPGKINSVKELSPDLKGFYCLFDKALC
jgi:hypothetical protein